MSKTKIEWCDYSWNPVTGCTKVSDGCLNCYALKMTHRLQAMGAEKYLQGEKVAFHKNLLDIPRNLKKSKRIFVNSMSDLFHPDLPKEYLDQVLLTMQCVRRHVFLLLTKRIDRVINYYKQLTVPCWAFTYQHTWLGITLESDKYYDRFEMFSQLKDCVLNRFISIEPMLSPMRDINLSGIKWVIVGGETGSGAREIKEEWVVDIKNKCKDLGIPFFFKKTGSFNQNKPFKFMLEEPESNWRQLPKEIKERMK